MHHFFYKKMEPNVVENITYSTTNLRYFFFSFCILVHKAEPLFCKASQTEQNYDGCFAKKVRQEDCSKRDYTSSTTILTHWLYRFLESKKKLAASNLVFQAFKGFIQT